MRFGSMPRDGGNLLFTDDQYRLACAQDNRVVPFLRNYVGSDEFINGGWR